MKGYCELVIWVTKHRLSLDAFRVRTLFFYIEVSARAETASQNGRQRQIRTIRFLQIVLIFFADGFDRSGSEWMSGGHPEPRPAFAAANPLHPPP